MASSAAGASGDADQRKAAEAAFGAPVFDEDDHHHEEGAFGGEAGHLSDRDDAVDEDVERSAQEAEVAHAVFGGDMLEKSVVGETRAMRSAATGHEAAAEERGSAFIHGSSVAIGKLADGLVAYAAAADDASRMPDGPPPLPQKPFYLKHSHQLMRGATYGEIMAHVVTLLGQVDAKMKVRVESGRVSCHLYTPRGEWVQFKVRFYGYPSDDASSDPHFAVEFDRQQGSAFLLERVYRACMQGLQAQGIELKGHCRSAAQVMGAAPGLPEPSADPVGAPAMVRGSSSASAAGTSGSSSAGAAGGSSASAGVSTEESTASSPAEALGPLMEMMKSEWADASEEALASLARLVGEDASGSAKAAVAGRPGLLGVLLSMASGTPVGSEEAAAAAATSDPHEMSIEAARSAASAVLRRMDGDEDEEDGGDEEDEEDDGTGYRHDDPAFEGAGAEVDRAQHQAAVADLAACFMRRRVDVVRRTLAAIALQQSLSGSDEVRDAVLALPGAVAALVAASSGREDGDAEAAIDGAFRPAIATLRHTCIKSIEFLCDSAEGQAAVGAAGGKAAMEAVAGCGSVDDRARESARHVMELL